MKKIKVGSFAKEIGITTKELLKILSDLGIDAKTAASSIDEESAGIVKEIVAPKREPEEKPIVASVASELKVIRDPEGEGEKPTGPVIETNDISVKDLAEMIRVKNSELIKELMKKGVMANLNQRINAEMAKDIAGVLGKQITIKVPQKITKATPQIKINQLTLRPPIVTIMGHVDHGKTKLLDAIRKTRVAEGEAGGITQHIGAYQVEVHGKKVTFLDTPGHEAFTALRARGAKITDIAVLVIAADDGIKPQTVEAIDHARAAGIPIIIALNKIDKPDANPDRVKQQLAKMDLTPEEWGGKTVTVATSAITGKGINELLEMILLVAEVQELKADPQGIPVGVVIESKIDKGRGPVADVLIKTGTLRVGDIFTIGATYGKVRALFNDEGKRQNEAGPSTPVEVLGATEVPTAGDLLQVMPSEKEARLAAEKRRGVQKAVLRGKVLSLEDYSKHIKKGEKKDLKLVIKADVQGSLDAIAQSITNLIIENIQINLIHQAVGPVTESDVMLAKASAAVIIGFNVSFEGNAENLSNQEGVEVRHYDIIYKLIDDVKLAMEGLLEPEYEEVTIGHAEVRNLFRFSKVGVIAGCFVNDGKMQRGCPIRIFRGTDKIFEGKLESLKRFKDDVKAVEQNFECGIALQGYTDFKEGDEIEAFEIREKARKR
ncbi:translation initiation factor IF-2 [candidate division WOR-1 bacterium RIFCSPLOWO2_02_FULL_46_20]|uniref:Translation initiation factor IF-2 n=2 Tax=Saganbacteria TaxID=1703751 RepID=A0A1F4RDB0_UNCSA|nr:MAG: translation initiation factor IF-2 [candidate division WOR-1 bacterium RIFCSPHIGHO2_02_FULL_45_12]OGC06171.1 MAG: translation initiation factor IF-2 [candidate division WOR-1 bacterium RIFCSPLOWO2_02_FULL_46_20]OGC09408.1 MAG: translation initiation factor IF-2 [candidate division WOR-1 bacterium RIFCSPLOWO2_12_FULL_45_9]